jgi:signal transduction histidine kinase
MVLPLAKELDRAPDPHSGPGVSSLRGLSDALGAADDVDAVAAAGAGWIRRILGTETAVSLACPDGSGRLRVVSAAGSMSDPRMGLGRRHQAERRLAFDSLRPSRHRVGGLALAIFPLSSGGEGVGVLEVLAAGSRLDAAGEVLEVGVSLLGVALQTAARNARHRREVETLERASSLGAALVRARSAEEAVRVAIRFLWERFRVPVVGWSGAGGAEHTLVESRGLGNRVRRDLEQAMPTVPPWASLSPAEREGVKDRFRDLAGVPLVSALDVEDAVLLVGRPVGEVEGSLEMVGSLLAEVLRVLDSAALANMRHQRLDMGLAWTAHELRGPLLGIRAALELLLDRQPTDPAERAVLRTSLQELDQLTGSAEAILAWAVGERPLDRGEADLVRIVEEAVESCRLEFGEERPVVISAPERAVARVDPTHLRTVVSNLVRNALAYSFRGTKVDVIVENAGDHVQLSVRDEGPEIPIEERRLIFDPFARGSMSISARNGSGLGLFIARQVVEAHGGRIWVESERGTTTFRVRLPVEGRGLRRFAS